MKIDEIAQRIISAYNAKSNFILIDEVKEMLYQIKENESMFSIVEHPYIVAKSLYFMLTEDWLTTDDKMSVVKLAYFCLLKNYLKNANNEPKGPYYEELVLGCKLALVLIAMQHQFLMYGIIMRQADFINPQTHMRNQTILFGGIVKEAEINHLQIPSEEIIESYFIDIFEELRNTLPTGKKLALLKEDCKPVIEQIETSISVNLKESWIERMM